MITVSHSNCTTAVSSWDPGTSGDSCDQLSSGQWTEEAATTSCRAVQKTWEQSDDRCGVRSCDIDRWILSHFLKQQNAYVLNKINIKKEIYYIVHYRGCQGYLTVGLFGSIIGLVGRKTSRKTRANPILDGRKHMASCRLSLGSFQ